MEFHKFPSIARLLRDIIITEKIDGTNAQIYIDDDMNVFAGSRNRYLTIEDDHLGFAKWVKDNEDDLRVLGPGRHFGEWWGQGIQRGYGLKEKRFSLFNTHKWSDPLVRPFCCHVVPLLWIGPFETEYIDHTLLKLESCGSQAAPGFMNPEGIVIYHSASNTLFKKTIKNDEIPKSLIKEKN